MAGKKKKASASRPGASAWDKIRGRSYDETLDNRDVHGSQQLDRSEIGQIKSKKPRQILAIIVGIILAVLTWMILSMLTMMFFGVTSMAAGLGGGESSSEQSYYVKDHVFDASGATECYFVIDAEGERTGDETCYESPEDVPVPTWYEEAQAQSDADEPVSTTVDRANDPVSNIMEFKLWKLIISLLVGLGFGAVLNQWAMRNLAAQNQMQDTTDINQHTDDQHLALPEEIQRKFDPFPDAGAHSAVAPSSMISHNMISNKGLKKIAVTQRATEDRYDKDGELEYYKGDPLRDGNGEIITKMMPMIDEKFSQDLFDASGLPDDKDLRTIYDARKIEYKPEAGKRDKIGDFKTFDQLINEDWEFPEYEVQRPGGVYIVDTAPVNTMVLAITRAGKGQTYIEPMIDMWMREKRQHNMVINDPKGELLRSNYVTATMRGYQVVQFNLINANKTDIYNPLGMAAESARAGDTTKTAMYVENIADVFFPVDGGDDPVWPNAANNAFKRAAYGLIDFYLEEERESRAAAIRSGKSDKVLETELDQMWGKVTLYNCYQLFVQMTAKKLKNPVNDLNERANNDEFVDDEGEPDQEEYDRLLVMAERRAFLWEDKPEMDMLTLFFNATSALPKNSMRTLIGNADNALRSMAGAEKMLASVYGIAITAMSFFTDPTISTLTSGTPSQNVDLGGLSFPRRMGVRFGQNFLKSYNLIGQQAKWDAFEDENFTKNLGKDFEHEDTVSREGWARYFFEGKFATDISYVRLQIVNPQTKMLIRSFYFRFKKDYQYSLNGRYYITDPITDQKIIRNGLITELVPETDGKGATIGYKPGHTNFTQTRLTDLTASTPSTEEYQAQAIVSTNVRYSESPKAVFLVTPPHLMKYAKLILILVKQLVDLNFDQSYMTKGNQKPLYKTRYMLDELGNLQSEGKGIAGFETMLSIGLGQEQQFTLILQTLQQLRDVYGESVDKIVQGNTSNIVFLKSTDDSMIETLSKMSGTQHKAYRDSKTVTKDMERLVQGMAVEGKVSHTLSVKEEPLVSYNDMAFLTERNSIVFRAGDPPVWNRNGSILPMSFQLFDNKIIHPGHEYSLQTIPTLSSALDFDVRLNQPNFKNMFEKRVIQAERAEYAKEVHRRAYNIDEFAITQLDPDLYSDEIMGLIENLAWEELGVDPHTAPESFDPEAVDDEAAMFFASTYESNEEGVREIEKAQASHAQRNKEVYAGQTISLSMLTHDDGSPDVGSLKKEILGAFTAAKARMARDTENFRVLEDGSLTSPEGKPYITKMDVSEDLAAINAGSEDEDTTTYSEGEIEENDLTELGTFRIERGFYEFLIERPTWKNFAEGEFDREMAKRMD